MLKPPFHNSFKADVLDLAPMIIAVHDTDYNIVWANKAYQKATGMTLKEIEGRKCFSVWGLAKPCHGCPVLIANETGKQQEAELTPENQDHWPATQGSWLSKAVPVRDAEGNIIGAVETAYEITERKQVEEDLRKSEMLHKEAQRVAQIGHWELDSPSGTPLWSEEIFHIFGLNPKKSEPSFAAHVNIIHDEDWGLLDNSI